MISTSPVISRHDERVLWRRQFLKDVVEGLKRPQKEIACKYFYDEVGSALFDEICELDEYYLTRTEMAILETHVAEMAESIGEDCELIELGSGNAQKTRLLLEQLRSPRAYLPVDISREPLELSARYGWRRSFPICECWRFTAISPNRSCCRRPEIHAHAALCIFPVRPSVTSVPKQLPVCFARSPGLWVTGVGS